MRLPVWRTRCACWPLADDPKARLGMHRAAGIARTQGYGEVSVSGLKFSELLTAQKNPAVQVKPLPSVRRVAAPDRQKSERNFYDRYTS